MTRARQGCDFFCNPSRHEMQIPAEPRPGGRQGEELVERCRLEQEEEAARFEVVTARPAVLVGLFRARARPPGRARLARPPTGGPAQPRKVVCEGCDEEAAHHYCGDCKAYLCRGCSAALHLAAAPPSAGRDPAPLGVHAPARRRAGRRRPAAPRGASRSTG